MDRRTGALGQAQQAQAADRRQSRRPSRYLADRQSSKRVGAPGAGHRERVLPGHWLGRSAGPKLDEGCSQRSGQKNPPRTTYLRRTSNDLTTSPACSGVWRVCNRAFRNDPRISKRLTEIFRGLRRCRQQVPDEKTLGSSLPSPLNKACPSSPLQARVIAQPATSSPDRRHQWQPVLPATAPRRVHPDRHGWPAAPGHRIHQERA